MCTLMWLTNWLNSGDYKLFLYIYIYSMNLDLSNVHVTEYKVQIKSK